mgnify:CR=1 FL=1
MAKEGDCVPSIIVSVVFVSVFVVTMGAFFDVDVGDGKRLGLNPQFGAVGGVDPNIPGRVSVLIEHMAEDESKLSGTAPHDML